MVVGIVDPAVDVVEVVEALTALKNNSYSFAFARYKNISFIYRLLLLSFSWWSWLLELWALRSMLLK